jgi:hypothetical protein
MAAGLAGKRQQGQRQRILQRNACKAPLRACAPLPAAAAGAGRCWAQRRPWLLGWGWGRAPRLRCCPPSWTTAPAAPSRCPPSTHRSSPLTRLSLLAAAGSGCAAPRQWGTAAPAHRCRHRNHVDKARCNSGQRPQHGAGPQRPGSDRGSRRRGVGSLQGRRAAGMAASVQAAGGGPPGSTSKTHG